jgi:hypothetical protein
VQDPALTIAEVQRVLAEANKCVVVTDNEKDFAGLKIVNPLRT